MKWLETFEWNLFPSTAKKGVWTQAAEISTVGPRIVQGRLLWSATRDTSLKTGLWSQGMRFFLPEIAPGVGWGMPFSALRQYQELTKLLAIAATGDCGWDSIYREMMRGGRRKGKYTWRSVYSSRRLGSDNQPQ